jgi:uncharacterized membrane protein
MDTVLDVISIVVDKVSQSRLAAAAVAVIVLLGAIYILFGSAVEFIKLLTFLIVATAVLVFLWVTGHV